VRTRRRPKETDVKHLVTMALVAALAGCGGGDGGKAPADPLAGTAWSLDLLPGVEKDAGVEVTLTFHEGRIAGTAGCNRYFASYSVKGDSLKLGPAGATKMMCPEPQMTVEDAFLAALARVRTYRVADGRLVLTPAEGGALEFAATAFTPEAE
jgi:heat shock protein HslJ